jgi:hypothetical protein
LKGRLAALKPMMSAIGASGAAPVIVTPSSCPGCVERHRVAACEDGGGLFDLCPKTPVPFDHKLTDDGVEV